MIVKLPAAWLQPIDRDDIVPGALVVPIQRDYGSDKKSFIDWSLGMVIALAVTRPKVMHDFYYVEETATVLCVK